MPFEFLHVRLFTLSNMYTGRIEISIHGICVAITLFKVHFITWHGEIDIGEIMWKFSPVRLRMFLVWHDSYEVIESSWTQHVRMLAKAIPLHLNFQDCENKSK